MREVMFVAGETSGDMHASRVADELRRRAPQLELVGIGGERMERAGVELLERTGQLAVMGFTEALRQAPHHLKLLKQLARRLASGNVELVILVDYPGFNLRVAGAAREAGVPVLYYITPQVWAWGAGRLRKMARTITRAAVILPFEEPLLRAAGIETTFVGHPLLDAARELPDAQAARRELGVESGARVLALFPGSRQTEIERHLDTFVTAARDLERRYPGLQVIVRAAPGITLDAARCPFPVVSANSFTVFRAADAALCKSGTSTLEAAVAGCPLVIAYRTGAWEYLIGRLIVRIPHIGLVNVIAGREVAPEFVQGAARAPAIAGALAPLLDRDDPRRAEQVAALGEVRARLGTHGADTRVATLALEMIG